MGMDRHIAIIRGIAIPEKGEHCYMELLEQFLKKFPDSPIVQYAISENYLDPDDLDVDDFDMFLMERGLLIDNEMLDYAYIGHITDYLEDYTGARVLSDYVSTGPLSREGSTSLIRMIGDFIDILRIMWGTGDWYSDEKIFENTYLVQWWD